MMLEGAGFAVIDLGVDVSGREVYRSGKRAQTANSALSALLTTTMNNQQTVIEALKAADLRDKVKVMGGGAPVTQSFCDPSAQTRVCRA